MELTIQSNVLRGILKNVYFINGTAYAGKSTMVHRLAVTFDGIECGENYHDNLQNYLNPDHQPALCYTKTMQNWQEFISRTTEEYERWMQNCSREGAPLEILQLCRYALEAPERKIFVDTNIPTDILREIAGENRVLFMLAPTEMSVNRFFDRPDAEKQFIYQRILEAPDPDAALAHYRKILSYINRAECHRAFEESGFFVYHRTPESTPDEAFYAVAGAFGLI